VIKEYNIPWVQSYFSNLADTELDLKNKKPITINELLIAIHPTQCPHCGAKKE